MPTKDQLPILQFETPTDWEAWLEGQHARSPGLWLKLARKDSGIPSVTYPQALEVALCYGWIDSQKASFDQHFWLQRFTPRKAQSKWSKINRSKAEALIAADKMKAAGLREVELARQDGRWDQAYDPPSTAVVPPDLQEQLDQNPRAQAFFSGLDSRNRYAILYRLQSAKRPETRARHIARFIAMLNEGKKLY